jgi:hypothetical protein
LSWIADKIRGKRTAAAPPPAANVAAAQAAARAAAAAQAAARAAPPPRSSRTPQLSAGEAAIKQNRDRWMTPDEAKRRDDAHSHLIRERHPAEAIRAKHARENADLNLTLVEQRTLGRGGKKRRRRKRKSRKHKSRKKRRRR